MISQKFLSIQPWCSNVMICFKIKQTALGDQDNSNEPQNSIVVKKYSMAHYGCFCFQRCPRDEHCNRWMSEIPDPVWWASGMDYAWWQQDHYSCQRQVEDQAQEKMESGKCWYCSGNVLISFFSQIVNMQKCYSAIEPPCRKFKIPWKSIHEMAFTVKLEYIACCTHKKAMEEI